MARKKKANTPKTKGKTKGKFKNLAERLRIGKPKRFSKTFELPINQIHVQPEIFQGRSVPYAKETYNKILREGYDKSYDPIVVWKDPKTNKYIVISGHSRLAAARELYKRGQKDLATLPVKEFLGDRDDAIDYALIESNRSGKAEGIESDIKAYIRAKQRGYNKDFLRSIFKKDSYIYTLDKLAHLDPKGLFIERLRQVDEALAAGEAKESKHWPYLLRNAVWVGILRKKYPQLTNRHEREIFDFLYKDNGKNAKTIKKDDFFKKIENIVESPGFDPKKPLFLKEKKFKHIKETDPEFLAYKRRQAAIKEANDERLQKERLSVQFARLGKNSKAKEYLQQANELQKWILQKYDELFDFEEKLKKHDKTLEKSKLF